MRILMSLTVAGVLGSAAVGAVTQYVGSSGSSDPRQTLKTLLKEDRPAALRLFEEATFKCLPELDKLKSTKARKFLPRMIGVTVDMAEKSGGKPTQSDKAAIDKEIRQLVQTISDTDAMMLVAAVNRLNAEKSRIKSCFTQTFADEARRIQATKGKELLPDVELRGS